MNILVTGSSGRIGSKIAETVNKHGVCIGVDLVPGKFTTLLGNILNKKFMDEVMAKVDAVIHAAAYLTPHVGVVSDEEFHRVNVVGTEVLLELAIRRKIEQSFLRAPLQFTGVQHDPRLKRSGSRKS